MLSFFLALVAAERNFLVLTDENIEMTLRKNKNVLVRFYSQHKEDCLRSADDYNLVAKSFQNSSKIVIAGIDCGKYRRECLKRSVFEYPTERLYDDEEFVEYSGGHSWESIIDWASKLTGAKPAKIEQLVHQPNGKTFKKLLDEKKCVIAFFHAPWCTSCKRFMPRYHRAARAFQGEKSVAFASIDADRYRSFIRDYDAKFFPVIKLFVKGKDKAIDFDGKKNKYEIADFINDNCKTSVSFDSLDDEFGLIDEADTIVEEFFENGKKELYIQKLKSIPNTKIYVNVMESYLKNPDYLLEESERLSAAESLTDDEKKKLNIIRMFKDTEQQ